MSPSLKSFLGGCSWAALTAALFSVWLLLPDPPFPGGARYALASTKLSQITNGNLVSAATDQIVTVRSGTTDVLSSVGSLAGENLTAVIIDNGSGGGTIGSAQVTNAMLANPSATVNGQTCTLGATCSGNATLTLSSDATGSGTTSIAVTLPANVVTNSKAAQAAANTMKGNWTAGTTNEADNAMPSCADSGGNHLNYVNGTGVTCGTSDLHAGTVTSVTFTGDGLLLSNVASSAVTTSGTLPATIANASGGTVLGNATGASAAPTYTTGPVLGSAAATAGTLGLASSGASGATVTLRNYGATSNYNYNFPSTAGSSGNVEISGGGGTAVNTWDTTSGTGTVLPLTSGATMTGLTLKSSGPTTPSLLLSSGATEVGLFSAGNSGTSLALQGDNGNMQVAAITGAVTITLTSPANPTKTNYILKQDGTGHVYSISGCKWAGGSTITYSSTASAIDEVSVMYDGNAFYCMGGAAFQ